VNKPDFITVLRIALKHSYDDAASILSGIDLEDVPPEILPPFCVFRAVSKYLADRKELNPALTSARRLLRVQGGTAKTLEQYASTQDGGTVGSTTQETGKE